jgi:hypothetical protein
MLRCHESPEDEQNGEDGKLKSLHFIALRPMI